MSIQPKISGSSMSALPALQLLLLAFAALKLSRCLTDLRDHRSCERYDIHHNLSHLSMTSQQATESHASTKVQTNAAEKKIDCHVTITCCGCAKRLLQAMNCPRRLLPRVMLQFQQVVLCVMKDTQSQVQSPPLHFHGHSDGKKGTTQHLHPMIW